MDATIRKEGDGEHQHTALLITATSDKRPDEIFCPLPLRFPQGIVVTLNITMASNHFIAKEFPRLHCARNIWE